MEPARDANANWRCKIDGAEMGPLTLAQVKKMFFAGKLKSTDFVSSGEPVVEWIPASAHPSTSLLFGRKNIAAISYSADNSKQPSPKHHFEHGVCQICELTEEYVELIGASCRLVSQDLQGNQAPSTIDKSHSKSMTVTGGNATLDAPYSLPQLLADYKAFLKAEASYREVSLSPDDEEDDPLVTTGKIAAYGKGMLTTAVLTPFLGPAANVVGAMIALNDPAFNKPQPEPDNERLINHEAQQLSLRGFPTKSTRQLDVLIACIKMQDVAHLIEIFVSDQKPEWRRGAIVALRYLGQSAVPAVDRLITCLNDEHKQVRVNALETLRHIGSSASAAVPAVIEGILREKNSLPVRKAIEAICEMEPPEFRLWPGLVNAIQNGSKSERNSALSAISSSAAEQATKLRPILENALSLNSSDSARSALQKALKHLPPP